jgi:hypothetical protein
LFTTIFPIIRSQHRAGGDIDKTSRQADLFPRRPLEPRKNIFWHGRNKEQGLGVYAVQALSIVA